MSVAIVDAAAITAPGHPLDPLTPDEIRRAAAAVRSVHDLGAGMMFETISLHEPDKNVVHGLRPGAVFPREAFVCAFDRTNGQVFEARVDLVADKVTDWRHVPGVRPRILLDDINLVGEVARADPRFRAALAKRGIVDIENVQVDPWSAGNYGLPDEEGRRLSHTFCWYRSEKNDNGYAHPIEGLCAVVDLDRAEVLCVDDYGAAEVPMKDRNYAARYRTVFRDDIKPLEILQPAGPSFSVEGNEVAWQKWRFRVGFNAREGLVLHTIGYQDGGSLRPIVHRAALSEMVVPYAHPGGGHFRKNAFDVGEYGIGVLANSLTLGCDCLGAIRYFDAWLADSKGDPYCIPSAVCLHEEDFGILWKHTDLFTGEVDVRRARRLVVSSISTVGNYEYGSFWYFHQDGSIHFEMKATGILNTAGLRPGESPDYGTVVSPGVYAHYHQHIFNMRLDMAVDGERNRVVESIRWRCPSAPTTLMAMRSPSARPSWKASRGRNATSISTRPVSGRSRVQRLATVWGSRRPTSCCLRVPCLSFRTLGRWWQDARPSWRDSSGSRPTIPTRFTQPASTPTRARAETVCRPGQRRIDLWSIRISSSGTASACTISRLPRTFRCSP